MDPILMYPAFRHGSQTPWGGAMLRDMFHKNIPDDRTGEALELSAIPGLNSVDETGRPLEELIRQYGADLVGTETGSPFPLLLKLLDAHEPLSVQVHPDDRYAAEKEHKLGKTEAWVILSAKPDAQIIFGVQPGTTMEELKEASRNGRAVEKLLHHIPIRPGEVYYIPAGTVHAICGTIVLYEIQQSSDVTYRFYDWDRTDSQGNRRELHLEKALDVTNLNFEPKASEPRWQKATEHGTQERLLEEMYFSLDRYRNCHAMPLVPDPRRFSVLTAIESGIIRCGEKMIVMPAGQTVLIPAVCGTVELNGGHFLNAFPTVRNA